MSTNFLIEGASCGIVQTERRRVMVPGILGEPWQSLQISPTSVRVLIDRRRHCVGYAEKKLYYGEYRLDDDCELHRELFMNETIFWGLYREKRKIPRPSKCIPVAHRKSMWSTIYWRCESFGTIACMSRRGKLAALASCSGVILLTDNSGKRVSHLCQGEALFPGMVGQPRPLDLTAHSECRTVTGLDVYDTTWVHNLHLGARLSFEDVIHATFAAGVQEFPVKILLSKRKHVTLLHRAYFVATGCIAVLIVVLQGTILYWRCALSLKPTANDEFGLSSLLASSSGSDNRSSGPVRGNAKKPVILLQYHKNVLRARIQR